MTEDDPGWDIWDVLFVICVVGAIVCYVISSFNPQQPLHHELNDAAGVLILTAFLLYVFS